MGNWTRRSLPFGRPFGLSLISPMHITILAIALSNDGQLDEAIAAYRQAIRLKPDYAEAHSNLGNALKDMGQLDEAIASLSAGHSAQA